MHKVIVFCLLVFLTPFNCEGQLAQTVKGKVVDKESKMPLTGVAISVSDIGSSLGAVTDIDGNFIIAGAPVGKHVCPNRVQ